MRHVAAIAGVLVLASGCDEGVELAGDGDDATSETDGVVTDDATGDDADAREVAPECPSEWPDPGSGCTAEGVRCEFGSETCCGVTHPSIVCTCGGGTWGCYYTDACMGAPFMCDCTTDADCEPGGYGRAWCEDGHCVPCDDSGRDCELACPDGFVPERNGCQPCECATAPCHDVGGSYCTCDALCGDPGVLCEAGLGRCIEDICEVIDCLYACDPLRGCVDPECESDADCKLIHSTCACQAVPVTDPRTELDPCLYEGGAICGYNTCEGDGVLAVCRGGICTEAYGPGCGG